MQNRRVLVTGGSRGIGAATAKKLARQGFEVSIHFNSSQQSAEAVSKSIVEAGGLTPNLLQFDIANRAATKSVLEENIEEHGAYYGVVCNAGISADAAFPALSDEQWDSVIKTNLNGFYNVLQPLVMPMIRLRQGGRIITLSSVSGLIGNRGQVNYSAAKAGVIGATKALAIELAKRKITVNCVAPGIIETQMIKDIPADEAVKIIPMGRFGQVDEVAATIGFLASDEASYVTRQVISVNGGMC